MRSVWMACRSCLYPVLWLHQAERTAGREGVQEGVDGGIQRQAESTPLVLNHRTVEGNGRSGARDEWMNEWEGASLKSRLTLRVSAVQGKRLAAFTARGWTSADEWHCNSLSDTDWQEAQAAFQPSYGRLLPSFLPRYIIPGSIWCFDSN